MKKSFLKAERRRDGAVHYKHDLGQHFLYDTDLLRSLVMQAGVQKTDRVLEIGPGAGTLTACLCEAAERVIAIEVDEAILPFLKVATQSYSNIEIIHGDVRKLNLPEIVNGLGGDFLVVANIPYNITTPIFDLFWGSSLPIRQMSVMIQKEVAQKLVALPGDDAYGLTSVRCQYYCQPEILAHVPAEAFTPPPKVDSAFVNLHFRKTPPLPVQDEARLWRMIRSGFAQRRKTLTNTLKSHADISQEALKAALEKLGFLPTVRAEALSVENWIELSNLLM